MSQEIRWFYSLNKDETSLMKNTFLSTHNCIICSETEKRKFTYFRTCFDFYKYAKDVGFENNCFYEVIRGTHPQKPYFDIDIPLNEEDGMTIQEKNSVSERIIPLLILAIHKIYPEIQDEDIFVFNSHGAKKRSFHIVIDRWVLPDYTHMRNFYYQVLEYIPDSWKKFVDSAIYKSIQQFRTLFSHKWNTERVKMIDPFLSTWKLKSRNIISSEQGEMLTFIASLISNTNDCCCLPFDIKEETQQHTRDIEAQEIEFIKNIIENMDHASCFRIGAISDSLICLYRLAPSFCQACERVHEHENPFVYVTMYNNVYFNCRRGDKSTKIGVLQVSDLTDNCYHNSKEETPITPMFVNFEDDRKTLQVSLEQEQINLSRFEKIRSKNRITLSDPLSSNREIFQTLR